MNTNTISIIGALAVALLLYTRTRQGDQSKAGSLIYVEATNEAPYPSGGYYTL